MNQRNLGIAILLMIITCGLYGIYWFIKLTNEVGQMSGDPQFRGEKTVLLSIVTLGIYSLVWAYQMGARVSKARQLRGLKGKHKGNLYVILTLLLLVPVVVMVAQNDFNEIL